MPADPQGELARGVDLIDEGEKVRAVLPMDFIDPDRANADEIHVGAASTGPGNVLPTLHLADRIVARATS
jgi:hypothetical protein